MKTPPAQANNPARKPGCLRRFVLRVLAIISPKWEVVEYGPLTQHLMFHGKKVGEEIAEYRKEINRAGKVRVWVTEKGGWKYQINPERLSLQNVEVTRGADQKGDLKQ